MDTIDRLRAWSYARQRLGDPAGTAEQALRAVVAVYATHPTAPLALWARTRSFTATRYRRIDSARKGLRIPCMRRTVFLVPRKHAAHVFTAVRASPAHAQRPLKRHGISTRAYEGLAKRILAAAEEPLPTRALEDAAGIKAGKLAAVLRCLRYEGRLLTLAGDSLHMSPHRYVATSAWIPEGLEAGDAADALAWLASEYLRAYGPARSADFAWWTGVTKKAAGKALEPHDTVNVGDGLMLLAKDEPAFARVKRLRAEVALLPKWDAYTMGHAPDGRRRFVHPDVQPRVYTPLAVGLPGDGNPVALVDGEAVATWTYTQKDGAAVQLFDTLGPKTRRRIDEKLDAVAGLLTS
ncbi:MAG: DNA glycosylase AlkZ-like family protein [Actinomycetota bacterium]